MFYFRLSVLLFGFGLGFSLWGETVSEHQYFPELQLRAEVVSGRSETVLNRITWPTVLDVVPDGTRVHKGQVLVEFDRKIIDANIENKQYEMRKVKIELEQELLTIDNSLRNIKDQIEQKKSELEITEAQRARLMSLPHPEDVQEAKGNLEIAQLNLQAAQQELEKTKRRLSKGMISKTQLEQTRIATLKAKVLKNQALQTYNYILLPATETSIEINRLNIVNLEMEIEKLNQEYLKKQTIAEIQRKTAGSRQRMKQRQLDEKIEELDYLELPSPSDGIVRYNPRFIRTLTEGGKPAKNQAILEIPDLSKLTLKGLIPEYKGSLFHVGDVAEARFAHRPGQLFRLKVSAIGSNPIDITSLSNARADLGKSSGIKVFEISFEILEEIPGLKVGMFADMMLHSSRPIVGPAIALDWVKRVGQESYLARAGVLENVEGFVAGNLFFINDVSWLGANIERDGQWLNSQAQMTSSSVNELMLLGELSPTQAIDVRVPTAHRWYRGLKVVWIVDEYTQVTKDDVIAKCESEELKKQLDDLNEELEKLLGQLDTLKRENEVIREEYIFKKSVLANQLKIAQLELDLTENGLDELGIVNAKANQQLADLDVLSCGNNLRHAQEKSHLYSELQLKDYRRKYNDALRNQIMCELQFESISKGSLPLKRQKAQLKCQRLQNNWDNLIEEIEIGNFKMNDQVSRSEKKVARTQREIRLRLEDREGFSIKAGGAGIVRYAKVWDGIKMSKLKPNVEVWWNEFILSLTNNSSMVVKINVPEKYYSRVKENMEVKINIPAMSIENQQGHVQSIVPIFKNKVTQDAEKIGLYTRQEEFGYSEFELQVAVKKIDQPFKPGVLAQVIFPFGAYVLP